MDLLFFSLVVKTKSLFDRGQQEMSWSNTSIAPSAKQTACSIGATIVFLYSFFLPYFCPPQLGNLGFFYELEDTAISPVLHSGSPLPPPGLKFCRWSGKSPDDPVVTQQILVRIFAGRLILKFHCHPVPVKPRYDLK